MKLILIFSKYLQIGLLFTFFLPFFPSGCKGNAEPVDDLSAPIIEEPYIAQDTSSIDTSLSSVLVPSAEVDTSIIKNQITNSSNEEETISDILIKKNSFLKVLLKPGNKYSGIGYIIDFSVFIIYFGIFISFFLWIFGLVLKVKQKKSFHLLNIIGLIFLYITNPYFLGYLDYEKLWGYWVCFYWAVTMIFLDLFSLLYLKRNKGI